MFAPHSAKIDIERCEPELSNAVEKTKEIEARNSTVAEQVMMNGLLKKGAINPARGKKKILAAMEREARLERLEDFIKYWIKWAKRYRSIEIPNWKPKNPSQMGCMEKIKEICAKNDIHLDLFIGCVWRAYKYRQAVPTVQASITYADTIYNENIDEVYDDLSCDAYIG